MDQKEEKNSSLCNKEEYKKALEDKPEEYFVRLFLYRKKDVINPERFSGPGRFVESFDKAKKYVELLSEIMMDIASLDEKEDDRILENLKDNLYLLHDAYNEYLDLSKSNLDSNKERLKELKEEIDNLKKRIKELIKERSMHSKRPKDKLIVLLTIAMSEAVKFMLEDVQESVLKVHATTIGVLLSYFINFHNIVVHDILSETTPIEDEKFWDYICAINLLTLQYGVRITPYLIDFPNYEKGFITHLICKPIEAIKSEPFIMHRVMASTWTKKILELMDEFKKGGHRLLRDLAIGDRFFDIVGKP